MNWENRSLTRFSQGSSETLARRMPGIRNLYRSKGPAGEYRNLDPNPGIWIPVH